jgi:hypothetical protein
MLKEISRTSDYGISGGERMGFLHRYNCVVSSGHAQVPPGLLASRLHNHDWPEDGFRLMRIVM